MEDYLELNWKGSGYNPHFQHPLRYNKPMEMIKIKQHGCTGMFWLVGWLFTIGFLNLSFWRGVLAIIIWPYYLGVMIATLIR
jgi:hypothetical protein